MPTIELPSGVSIVTHQDTKVRPKIDHRKAIEAAETLRQMQLSRSPLQDTASIKISTGDPVGIFFHSDNHIGNIAVDYPEMMRQVDIIGSMRNTFLALCGDIVDQAFIFREGGEFDNLTYSMQGEVAMGMLKDLDEAGKVLWYVEGNHDNFRSNFHQTYFGGFRFPIIGANHGNIDLTVGDTNLDVFAFHKISMGNSSMSPFLACQRALEYFDSDADVLVRGHTHRKAVAQYKMGIGKGQKLRTMIEAGTFKPEEHFQRSQGNVRMAQFDVGGAGIMVYPDRQGVTLFYDFDEGVSLLNNATGLRNILAATTGNILRGR